MAKKKKKREDDAWMWITQPFMPGAIASSGGAFNYSFQPPEEVIQKIIELQKDYMPLWKAYLTYTAITAGLPLGHETAGATVGVAVAKRTGVSVVIGGGIGYVGAILIGGAVGTIADPLDLWEGGYDVGVPFSEPTGFDRDLFNEPVIRGRLNPLYLAGGLG